MSRSTARERRAYLKKQRRAAQRAKDDEKAEKAEKAKGRSSSNPERQVKLFCDEAGNTGANYLDADQPFYVLAGWVVPAALETLWVARLDKIAAQWDSPELHANKLWKRERGKKLLLGVIEVGLEVGCCPVLSVADKRACLALRLIDALLDPVTNPAASWLPFQQNQQRKATAKTIASVAPESVVAFGDVLRNPTVETWAPVVDQLSQALEQAAHTKAGAEAERLLKIARSVRGAETNIAAIVRDEQQEDPGDPTTRRNVAMSMNLPTFVQFTRMLDDVLSRTHSVAELIHDQTRQFELAFARLMRDASAIGRVHHPMRLESGHSVLLGTSHIRSFRTADSMSERGLQAADALATCAANVARLVLSGKPLTGVDSAIAAAVYALNFASRVTGSPTGLDHYVGFDADWATLGDAVIRAQQATGWPQTSPSIKE